MKRNDLLRLALLFLQRRKARTALTVLGVIIGTVCIVLMLSVGVSNYTHFQETVMRRSSLTEICVRSEAGLSAADAAEIADLPHVRAASPVLQLPGRLQVGPYEAYVTLLGVLPEVLELQFAQGGLFPADGTSFQIVIGGDATRDFVDPASPPDYTDWTAWEDYMPDIAWLEEEFSFLFGYEADPEQAGVDSWLEPPAIPLRVAGVTERSANMDSGAVYVGLDAARQILVRNAEQAESLGLTLNRVGEILVRVDSLEAVEDVLSDIRHLGFEADSDIEFVQEMRSESSRQLMQLLLIGLISLTVSAIGIANTMYAGILERRRDIGVMKVLGMKHSRIQKLFVLEAACIGLLGGLAGLGISVLVVSLVNAGMTGGSVLGMYFAAEDRISIPWWIGGGAVMIAGATGILSGLWPAAKAARMSALEAMRTGS